jgi:hypothetical protein
MTEPDVRKGMPPRKLDRATFEKRYKSAFVDRAFAPLAPQLDAIAAAAWDAYSNGRKAPQTRKAGPGFADPDYDISVDWLDARAAIEAAQKRYDDRSARPRILLINGSARTEHTCPGEMSQSWRLIEIAKQTLEDIGGFEIDILDLSRPTSEYASPFTRASPASRPPWRSATGHAVAIRIIRSGRCMTG